MGQQPTYPHQPGQASYGGYPANTGGPQYRPPPPRKKRHWIRNTFISVIVLVVIIIIASALSSGGGVSTTPSGSSGTKVSPTSAPASHPAAAATIGSYFDVKDASGDSYRVTLAKVIDPAQGADQFTTPNNGKRFVGAVFTIKALSGSPSNEDANTNAVLVGSNGQSYTADFSNISGYTNFSNGQVNVAQGATTTGAVTFQVPSSVKVSKVQWTDSVFGSTVQWNVP